MRSYNEDSRCDTSSSKYPGQPYTNRQTVSTLSVSVRTPVLGVHQDLLATNLLGIVNCSNGCIETLAIFETLIRHSGKIYNGEKNWHEPDSRRRNRLAHPEHACFEMGKLLSSPFTSAGVSVIMKAHVTSVALSLSRSSRTYAVAVISDDTFDFRGEPSLKEGTPLVMQIRAKLSQ